VVMGKMQAESLADLDLMAERVCGEFQFKRQWGSEIRRCSVAASDMTEG
jgi:hypothetical protein